MLAAYVGGAHRPVAQDGDQRARALHAANRPSHMHCCTRHAALHPPSPPHARRARHCCCCRRFGEFQKLPQEAALRSSHFLAVASLGGLLGFLISFTSLYFMSRTTATIYSLTGSMNKARACMHAPATCHRPPAMQGLVRMHACMMALCVGRLTRQAVRCSVG